MHNIKEKSVPMYMSYLIPSIVVFEANWWITQEKDHETGAIRHLRNSRKRLQLPTLIIKSGKVVVK